MPPLASSKRPIRCAIAPVKAPRSWPKSSLSSRPVGMAAQLTLTKRALAAPAQVVDRARDQLLAGARLAEDEHRRVGRRDGLHLVQRALQRGRVADDLLEVVVGADLLLEVDLLGRELVLERGDLLERERVLDREGHLLRDRRDEISSSCGERLAAEPADAERAQPAVVHRERHAAHRLDPLREQQAGDLRRQSLQIARATAGSGVPAVNAMPAGEPSSGTVMCSLISPLPPNSIAHMSNALRSGVVDGEARVVVRDDAPQTSWRRRRTARAARASRRARCSPRAGAGGDRARAPARPGRAPLPRDAATLSTASAIWPVSCCRNSTSASRNASTSRLREAEAAETAQRRGERQHAVRVHALPAQDVL